MSENETKTVDHQMTEICPLVNDPKCFNLVYKALQIIISNPNISIPNIGVSPDGRIDIEWKFPNNGILFCTVSYNSLLFQFEARQLVELIGDMNERVDTIVKHLQKEILARV